jgi:hypothetical protein
LAFRSCRLKFQHEKATNLSIPGVDQRDVLCRLQR